MAVVPRKHTMRTHEHGEGVLRRLVAACRYGDPHPGTKGVSTELLESRLTHVRLSVEVRFAMTTCCYAFVRLSRFGVLRTYAAPSCSASLAKRLSKRVAASLCRLSQDGSTAKPMLLSPSYVSFEGHKPRLS